jgi:hypothetical protein
MNGDIEVSRERFEILKGWSIDSAFDKAKEVDRDAEQFGELLLAHLSLRADHLEAVAEFLAKAQRISHLLADSRSWLLGKPPSQITG